MESVVKQNCDLCPRVFDTRRGIARHRSEAHADPRPESCLWCVRTFKNKRAAAIHRRFCRLRPGTDIIPWTGGRGPQTAVPTGGFRPETTTAAFSHSNLAHEDPSESVEKQTCDLCPRVFDTRRGLRRHQTEVHADPQPERCLWCVKIFKNKRAAAIHQRYCKLRPGTDIIPWTGGRGPQTAVPVVSCPRPETEQNTFYTMIGVSKNASEEDLKQAYKRQALLAHPDKGGDLNKFRELAWAYEILSDPHQRQIYDQYGENALGMRLTSPNRPIVVKVAGESAIVPRHQRLTWS